MDPDAPQGEPEEVRRDGLRGRPRLMVRLVFYPTVVVLLAVAAYVRWTDEDAAGGEPPSTSIARLAPYVVWTGHLADGGTVTAHVRDGTVLSIRVSAAFRCEQSELSWLVPFTLRRHELDRERQLLQGTTNEMAVEWRDPPRRGRTRGFLTLRLARQLEGSVFSTIWIDHPTSIACSSRSQRFLLRPGATIGGAESASGPPPS